MLREFREFAFKGNVLDLAVAVMLGQAFNLVVQTLVGGMLTPLIGLIGGNPDLSELVVEVNGATFLVGDLVNAVIYFFIVAAVLFAVVKGFRLASLRRDAAEPAAPDERACPYCLEPVPVLAQRCRHCTSILVASPMAGSR
jgi:large conductance mechanosensitive channel